MTAKRLIISGRVQGVGYRDWMVQTARTLGVSGWVRNRVDGSVEALVAGDVASVEELSRLCRRGPRMAEVTSIDEDMADPPEYPGFRQVPTSLIADPRLLIRPSWWAQARQPRRRSWRHRKSWMAGRSLSLGVHPARPVGRPRR